MRTAVAPSPAWGWLAFGLATIALLIAAAFVSTAHAQKSRVSIGPGGIEVVQEESDSTDTTKGSIQWSNGTIEIDSPDDAGSVRVHAPFVHIDADASDLVRVFDDAHVRKGERVLGAVVAVFGSVTVEGQVDGDVVAVFGSVMLEPGAQVEGDVVAVGGAVRQPAGAVVNGESVSLSFLPMAWGFPTTATLLIAVALGWVVTLLMAFLLFSLFRDRMMRVAETASRRTGVSLAIGVMSIPLFLFSFVLLLVTLIGIPIALVLPFAYGFAVWAGQIAVTYVLGCRLLRRGLGEGAPWAPLVAGTLVVAAFSILSTVLSGPTGPIRTIGMFFGLVGTVLLFGLSVVGTGALIVSKFGSPPFEAATAAGPPPSPASHGAPSEPAPGTPAPGGQAV